MAFSNGLFEQHYLATLLVSSVAALLLTGLALLISRVFYRDAALQHSVLICALVLCLLSPILATCLPDIDAITFQTAWLENTGDIPKEDWGTVGTVSDVAIRASDSLAKDTTEGTPAASTSVASAQIRGALPTEPSSQIDDFLSVASVSAIDSNRRPWFVDAAFAFWFLMTTVLLLRMLFDWVRLKHIVSNAKRLKDRRVLDALNDARCSIGGCIPTTIMVSEQISVPMAFGITRATILFPSSWDQLSQSQLTDVLAHEIVHLKRLDPAILLLQRIAAAIYWPVVTLHILNRRLTSVREDICDNYVLRTRDPLDYGNTLVMVAKLACGASGIPGTLGMFRGDETFEQRISRLIDPNRIVHVSVNRRLFVAVGLLLTGICAFVCAVELESSPINQDNARASRIGGEGTSAEDQREIGSSWSTLKGRFIVPGAPPAPRYLKATKDTAVFDRPILDERLIVNQKNQGLANVVIWLQPKSGKQLPPEHESYQMTASDPVELRYQQRLAPHVLTFRTTQPLRFVNRDPVAHNARIAFQKNELYNIVIPPSQSSEPKISGAERRPVPVMCAIHPWQKAYLLVQDHPYMAITDSDGRFQIPYLPRGEWTFRFWHEEVGFVTHVNQEGISEEWERGRKTLSINRPLTDLGTMAIPQLATEEEQAKLEDDIVYRCDIADLKNRPIADARITWTFRHKETSKPFWTREHISAADGRFKVRVPRVVNDNRTRTVELTVVHPDFPRYEGGLSMKGTDDPSPTKPPSKWVALGYADHRHLRMSSGQKVTGTLVRPDGSPAVGVSVMVAHDRWGYPSGSDRGYYTKTDSQGRFRVVARPYDESPHDEDTKGLQLHWFPNDFAADSIRIGSAESDVGIIKLEHGISVEGRHVDHRGRPQKGAVIRAVGIREQTPIRFAVCDDEGRFKFGPMLPGKYGLSPVRIYRDNVSGQAHSPSIPFPVRPQMYDLEKPEQFVTLAIPKPAKKRTGPHPKLPREKQTFSVAAYMFYGEAMGRLNYRVEAIPVPESDDFEFDWPTDVHIIRIRAPK